MVSARLNISKYQAVILNHKGRQLVWECTDKLQFSFNHSLCVCLWEPLRAQGTRVETASHIALKELTQRVGGVYDVETRDGPGLGAVKLSLHSSSGKGLTTICQTQSHSFITPQYKTPSSEYCTCGDWKGERIVCVTGIWVLKIWVS